VNAPTFGSGGMILGRDGQGAALAKRIRTGAV
jgi:hypothetical protein